MSERDDPRFETIRRRGGERYAAFLAAGYREWYSGGRKSTPYLLQKCIREGGERLYFINAWVYDFTEFRADMPISFSPEVQFNMRAETGPTFDVTLCPREHGPEEIERFFRDIYDRMGCTPYGD